VEGEVREEAGDHEEGGHPEDVQAEEGDRERGAAVDVLHRPDLMRTRQERHGGVKCDAQQQGEAPYGVQGVKPLDGWTGCGRRHGRPPLDFEATVYELV
jgi:hypothetical protein